MNNHQSVRVWCDLRVPGALSHHEHTGIVDRPDGCASYLFLHFASEIVLQSTKGRCHERPGTWIVYSPDFQQHYGLSEKTYVHDWFYLEGSATARLFSELSLPFNTPVISTIGAQISLSVQQIANEIYTKPDCWEKSVSLQVELLFIRLSRDLQECSHLSAHQKEVRTRFDLIRNEIRLFPQARWSVRVLAEKAGMSQSRFTTLYSQLYGVSPVRDMIGARMQKSCQLLRNTTLPLKRIALEVGFEDVCYFHRVFTGTIGKTPGGFRNQV